METAINLKACNLFSKALTADCVLKWSKENDIFHWQKVVCVEICLGNHKIGCNFVKGSGQLSSSVMDCPGGEEVLCGPLKDTDEKWLRDCGNL